MDYTLLSYTVKKSKPSLSLRMKTRLVYRWKRDHCFAAKARHIWGAEERSELSVYVEAHFS